MDGLSSGVVSTCLGEDSSNFTKQLGKNLKNILKFVD